jgi:hypothetical protein
MHVHGLYAWCDGLARKGALKALVISCPIRWSLLPPRFKGLRNSFLVGPQLRMMAPYLLVVVNLASGGLRLSTATSNNNNNNYLYLDYHTQRVVLDY